jgi:hypothetical protein
VERRKPPSVGLGGRARGFQKEGEANTRMVLVPRDGDAEGGIDLAFGTPVFQKVENLAFAVKPFPTEIAAAAVVGRAVEEVTFSVAVIAGFCKHGGHGLFLGAVERLSREETLRQHVDGGQVNGVVVRVSLGASCWAGSKGLAELGLLELDLVELCFAWARRRLVMAQCLMGSIDRFGRDLDRIAFGRSKRKSLTTPVLSSTKPIIEKVSETVRSGVSKRAPKARDWWQSKSVELTKHQIAGELPLPCPVPKMEKASQ